MKKIQLLGLLFFFSVSSSYAAENDFQSCVANLTKKAKAEGISNKTIEETLAIVKPKPQVIKLDKKQPEFSSTFADYFNKRVTDWRINKGKILWKTHHELLKELTVKYGVPGQYILAFWGLETNYGSYKGNLPVIDSLVTLACDPRRAKFFSKELIQALKIKQRYGFAYKDMKGSWAGAMGHTQFMPSTYAKYAIDADKDGKPDLWNSSTDALTSAAYFLNQLGWKRAERWGREIKLPKEFDYTLVGAQQKMPLNHWKLNGVMKADGSQLAVADMSAAVYLPAGHTGPAFLGYNNFKTIMRWNNSEFYAIAVGHLADRIVGAPPLSVAPPVNQRLKRSMIKELQQKLANQGYDVGEPDGILGNKTSNALQAFQKSKGLIADGFPDATTFESIGIKKE
ncbi:lytic murein transglycosylase [Parashewanella spongiae]|uniref:Lytic murein transglycosylase n=1 Tax=Parashewanella spongiae TaxID=342950 RepID=A0A3A6TQC2_9GAMM|nr:lytic murein transglycosylase [Parashewanella spongiae]MCL1077618.1 lytic murein transglycosylase [Parashewanella spongiae]RJY06787.1 lytic murein transglycosylase [Parashewanella spongiae]